MSGGGGMDHKGRGKCTSQQTIPKGPVRMRWGERVGGRGGVEDCRKSAASF